MQADPSAVLDSVRDLLRWGSILLGALGLLIALWVVVRGLTRRWWREVKGLASELRDTTAHLDADLARLEDETALFPRDISAPYATAAGQLYEKLDHAKTIALNLAKVSEPSQGWTAEPSQGSPTNAWHRLRFLLVREPNAARQRRSQLRAALVQAKALRGELDAADALLKELRQKPLATARKARELGSTLETALGLVAALQMGGVRGERLDDVVVTLQSWKAQLASLPAYLFTGKESQIARLAQPPSIVMAWRTLSELEPAARERMADLTHWQSALSSVPAELEQMDQTVASATTCLEQTHPSIDTKALSEAWAVTSDRARELDACYEAPTLDDLDGLDRLGAVTQKANHLVAQLASLEALRGSLEEKFAQGRDRLDELERQLRQLADAGRYPLDRVPFQGELDRIRRQLTALGGTSPTAPEATPASRTTAQLESALASAQVIDQQLRALTTRLAEAREDRRRLVELLDAGTRPGAAAQVDWLVWAHDLHARTRGFDEANWTSGPRASTDEDLRVPQILADAEALNHRRGLWIPEHKEDLLEPSTLARRVREVQAILTDTEAFQNRLDRITRLLQRLQQTEERVKADLETAYGALDRLEIVAAGILPAALSEEDNHWSEIRAYLSQGYDLDAALDAPAEGTVWEKAVAVADWIAACLATLSDWHRVLQRELDATRASLTRDLGEVSEVAPFDDEPAVVEGRRVVELAASPSRSKATPDAAGLTALSTEVADRLRALAQIDKAVADLTSSVLTPLAEPVDHWHAAQQEAEAAYRQLQRLELQSARQWPPVSCDTASVKAQLDRAAEAQATLAEKGSTIKQVLSEIRDLTERYRRASSPRRDEHPGIHLAATRT